MLSIGEFSKICKVSTKTLRHYAEIGLLLPAEVNPESGYRYYSVEQLETMLLIGRLKEYHFSLEEIKELLWAEEDRDEKMYLALIRKEKEIKKQMQEFAAALDQLNGDISNLEQGKTIMSYMKTIDVTLTEVPAMSLLFVRKMVRQDEFSEAYGDCFGKLFRRLAEDGLTMAAPPMVLFHSAEFSPSGLDTEFAVPVRERAAGTREFFPGLCLKTVLRGSYSGLPSVYAKQRRWAEEEGYASSGALYEVYVTDPSQVSEESELITEIYYPIRKDV
ncbi:MerR family transcriptional regulator [Anaerovorax odorimutans]|uniref:MerR family transcriptional regulator n=1 Tax=Anaerovorax odorimutans TaxID=109327 RepID=A0ABT1RSJ2_9FIRM|nr:MerR family transcriptional regulator [Anaerovorax odorimutans]MCQ4638182.1 MerR family transcriptional regulator [Anaerovorax odorimutans]